MLDGGGGGCLWCRGSVSSSCAGRLSNSRFAWRPIANLRPVRSLGVASMYCRTSLFMVCTSDPPSEFPGGLRQAPPESPVKEGGARCHAGGRSGEDRKSVV